MDSSGASFLEACESRVRPVRVSMKDNVLLVYRQRRARASPESAAQGPQQQRPHSRQTVHDIHQLLGCPRGAGGVQLCFGCGEELKVLHISRICVHKAQPEHNSREVIISAPGCQRAGAPGDNAGLGLRRAPGVV